MRSVPMVTETTSPGPTEVGPAHDGTFEGLALWGFLALTLASSLAWVLWLLE